MRPRIVLERDIADLEARARELPRRRLGSGYRREEVDTFILEAGRAVRRAGPQVPSCSGGYQMRAVDEYLDDVTDLLLALLQENEALRSMTDPDDEGMDR